MSWLSGTNSYNSANDYLSSRNKKYFRGHSIILHPLYEQELNNGIECITSFLSATVLKQAFYLRQKNIFALTLEKCWKNTTNSYTFSESEVCEELILERDSILNNIKTFNKEVEIRVRDIYEKEVKYSKDNSYAENNENFSVAEFEKSHRGFLEDLNSKNRFTYYNLAKKLFIDSVQLDSENTNI